MDFKIAVLEKKKIFAMLELINCERTRFTLYFHLIVNVL